MPPSPAVPPSAEDRAVQRMRWRHLLVFAVVFALAYPLSQWQAVRGQQWAVTTLAWDAHVPFLPWSIVPYMMCTPWLGWGFLRLPAPFALRAYSQRLLLATALACVVFNAWPTGFAPGTGPLWRLQAVDLPVVLAPAYAWLGLADAPHNLLPSLHATYAALLGAAFWPLCRHAWQRLALITAVLWLVASALLTHQHTLADVAAGLLLAALVGALVREPREPLDATNACRPGHLRHADVAWVYTALALLALGLMVLGPRPGWLRAVGGWLAVCCAWVAWAYARRDAGFLHKRTGGYPLRVRLLAGPYLAGYALSGWLDRHLRREPAWHQAAPGLWLGRRLTEAEARTLPPGLAVVDLANERSECHALRRAPYLHVPLLDLVPPPPEAIEQVRREVARHHAQGRGVYLHCAMGHGRAPAVVQALHLV